MIFTVVYISDDISASCYGQFSTREAAQRFADKLDASLEEDRDLAGGGAGKVEVCKLQRRTDW